MPAVGAVVPAVREVVPAGAERSATIGEVASGG